jgi:hypothetical protein
MIGWIFAIAIIASLAGFNVFAADAIMRLRLDIKDILKAVKPPPLSQPTVPSSPPPQTK